MNKQNEELLSFRILNEFNDKNYDLIIESYLRYVYEIYGAFGSQDIEIL
jgi:hypothetical protein